MAMIIRQYSELVKLPTFEERYAYLRLNGRVGEDTFGFERYLNQILYKSKRWRKVRELVIIRDDGCDLGIDGMAIAGKVIVHHMNPINLKDVENLKPEIFDPEFLICVSHNTHEAIHYGDVNLLPRDPAERRPNDTCPWK